MTSFRCLPADEDMHGCLRHVRQPDSLRARIGRLGLRILSVRDGSRRRPCATWSDRHESDVAARMGGMLGAHFLAPFADFVAAAFVAMTEASASSSAAA